MSVPGNLFPLRPENSGNLSEAFVRIIMLKINRKTENKKCLDQIDQFSLPNFSRQYKRIQHSKVVSAPRVLKLASRITFFIWSEKRKKRIVDPYAYCSLMLSKFEYLMTKQYLLLTIGAVMIMKFFL